jgi:hypothetical protein
MRGVVPDPPVPPWPGPGGGAVFPADRLLGGMTKLERMGVVATGPLQLLLTAASMVGCINAIVGGVAVALAVRPLLNGPVPVAAVTGALVALGLAALSFGYQVRRFRPAAAVAPELYEGQSPGMPEVSELAILALVGHNRAVRPRGIEDAAAPGERTPIVGSVSGQPSSQPGPARRRSGPPPATGSAAPTSARYGRSPSLPQQSAGQGQGARDPGARRPKAAG